jgi:hypothetical protein
MCPLSEEQFLQTGDNVDSSGRQLTRREFLKISGSGVFLFLTIGASGTIAFQPRGRSYPTDFNAYLKIGDDGRVSR